MPGRSPNPPRFFCPDLPPAAARDISDPIRELQKTESHHARNVLRLSVGDTVELFDGQGSLASAQITDFTSGRAIIHVTSVITAERPRPYLTVASAVPKGPRAETMVDQLSQAGVDRFVPLCCERSVAVPHEGKLAKFRRQSIESAKQCRRLWLMDITDPQPPDVVWSAEPEGLKLLAQPDTKPTADLTETLASADRVLVLIGPEGGWSERELAGATEAGCRPWTFSPHVLRIEAASVSAAVLIRYMSMK
ncbi:MAG: RsmE family RNA methyltransferase [Phycisphaeraceae bacterium]